MSDFKENVIEWLNGQSVVTVSLSQSKHINKVKKLAAKHNDVKIIEENKDGTLYAHIPLSYVKLSAPRQMTDEQKDKARARLLSIRG